MAAPTIHLACVALKVLRRLQSIVGFGTGVKAGGPCDSAEPEPSHGHAGDHPCQQARHLPLVQRRHSTAAARTCGPSELPVDARLPALASGGPPPSVECCAAAIGHAWTEQLPSQQRATPTISIERALATSAEEGAIRCAEELAFSAPCMSGHHGGKILYVWQLTPAITAQGMPLTVKMRSAAVGQDSWQAKTAQDLPDDEALETAIAMPRPLPEPEAEAPPLEADWPSTLGREHAVGSPAALSPDLVTLALLPRSQWQGLVHLDAIKVSI